MTTQVTIKTDRVDCDPFLDKGEQPTLYVPRKIDKERGEAFAVAKVFSDEWLVVDGPVIPGKELSVAKADGEYARVPLFSYTTPMDLAMLFAAGVNFGTYVRCPDGFEPNSLLIVLGDTYIVDSKYQCWLGLAFHKEC